MKNLRWKRQAEPYIGGSFAKDEIIRCAVSFKQQGRKTEYYAEVYPKKEADAPK